MNYQNKRSFTVFFMYRVVIFMTMFFGVGNTFAANLSSQNYSLENINFGEQVFYTAQDNTKPYTIANGPGVIEITPYSAKIKWLTNEPSNSSIFYGLQTGSLDKETSKALDNTSVHIIDLVNLTPKTTYYYKAMFRNSNGIIGESEVKSFTTPLPVPQISNLKITDITETTATVSFNTDFFTTSVLDYINTATLQKKSVGESGYFEDHSIVLDNLISNQEYSLTILSRDNEGHESSSSSVSFMTLKDVTPPVIENVKFETSQISGEEKARIIVSWHTPEISNSQIKYREGSIDQNEYLSTALDKDMVANHIETIANLKPQTTYRLVVFSADDAGNVGQSEEYIILTPKQKRTFFQIILDNIQELFKPFSDLFS